jgi:hypothetical protein
MERASSFHSEPSAYRGSVLEGIYIAPTSSVNQPLPTEETEAAMQDAGIVALNPGNWIWDGITGFWDRLWKQIIDFFQKQIIDWASGFGFIYITPAALSYKNPMVEAGAAWSLSALNGLVALFLVIAGYQVALHHYLDMEQKTLMAAVLRIVLATVVANLGWFFFLPLVVELSNLMSMSILGGMMHAAAGDVTLPLGGINWLAQPISWAFFIILHFLVAIFFIVVQAVRLAVLDVCIMFAPLWTMCLANEYTRTWGRLGATTFFCALFMQPIQVACLALGSALISNFGRLNYNDPTVCSTMPAQAKQACIEQLGHANLSGSMTPVVLVLGIATMYVASKIPGMLFSSAVKASIGSVNRDAGGAVKTVLGGAMSVVLFKKQLSQ